MDRYIVLGLYLDPPQVVEDVVDAANEDAAAQIVMHARAEAQGSGYRYFSAQSLADAVAYFHDVARWPAADVARGVENLATQYAHYHEPAR